MQITFCGIQIGQLMKHTRIGLYRHDTYVQKPFERFARGNKMKHFDQLARISTEPCAIAGSHLCSHVESLIAPKVLDWSLFTVVHVKISLILTNTMTFASAVFNVRRSPYSHRVPDS